MKHNLEKLKDVFVKNISILNPMVLVSTDDNCRGCGVHFPKLILNIYTLFLTQQLRISVINFEFVQDTCNFSHSC